MKAETRHFFKKVILAGLVFGLIVLGMVFFINGVKAEEAGGDELNKARNQLKTGEELVERHFIKVPDDEWPSQVIFDTIHVCYNGTIRWITMGNPNLLNQAPPYPVARAMTIHCFCVLDKLRTEYKYTPYVEMINKDDPMNPQILPNKFMTKAIQCIKEHNTLSGLVVLDQKSIDMFGEKINKQKDNETKIEQKIEVKPPDDNSGKSDSTPEQPKELPTEDAPLLNF